MRNELVISGVWERIRGEVEKALDGYPAWAPEALLFACAGAGVGFLARIWGKHIIWISLGMVGAVWALNFYDLIVINHKAASSLLGHRVYSMSDMWEIAQVMVRQNRIGAISAAIGFMFGWRLGR